MSANEYRPDIDGMRAVAVAAVTLFHLDISHVAGGYVGVDVFFVISGFLISTIIWKKQADGRFRLADFYLGRIRRLLPALYATVLATFVTAALILLPDDFARFSRSAIASLFSVSNILFYFEAGYWDSSSHLKPLLHTWSLGVEEQFYLVWPVFLIFCATALRKIPFVMILVFVSVLSTFAMLWVSDRDISGAFYLFPFRIFQFSLGALVGFATKYAVVQMPLRVSILRDLFACVGLGLIGYSVVTLSDGSPFPGANALPPTIGAMLVIYAGSGMASQGPLGRFLLENPLSVFIGKISYAIYLVHWPIIVLYRYQTGEGFGIVETIGLATATLLAAIALHYGVERQFYHRSNVIEEAKSKRFPNSKFAARVLIGGFIFSGVAAHAYFSDGWVSRFPEIALSPHQIEAGKQARFKYTATACAIGNLHNTARCEPLDGPQIDVLFLGNSHEPDGFNFILAGYADTNPLQLIKFGTLNDCASLVRRADRWTSQNSDCQNRLDALFTTTVLEQVEAVVISSYMPFSKTNVSSLEIVEDIRIRNPDIRVFVFGGYIGTKEDCSYIMNKSGLSTACREMEIVDYFENIPSRYPLYDRLISLADIYIDRVDLHCANRSIENCETETPDGVPFTYDHHHASLEFAAYGGKKYADKHPNLFRQYFGDHYSNNRSTEEVALYSLKGRFNEVIGSPIAEVISSKEGAKLFPVRSINEAKVGADTGVAHVSIGGSAERRLSGNKVRVRFAGTAEGATEVWMQYSTNDVGNSGWVKTNVVQGPFESVFEYAIPNMSRGGGDYIGIAPISHPIMLTDIEVGIVP